MTPSTARRLVSRDGSSRRDLSCRWYPNENTNIVCTYLALSNDGLQGADIAAVLVKVDPNGAVTETAVDPPTATGAALVAAANRACVARTRAIAALPVLPSLQQTGRLIPIEQRFEAALVGVGVVPGPPGPRSTAPGPAWFLADFLAYEQALVDLHRHVRQNAVLNVTQTDLTQARGAEIELTRTAAQDGIDCDFGIYLQPPPAPTIPARARPARSRPTPRSSINAPQNNPGFTAAKATAILAANPNNLAIQCDPGTNGWTYICSYLNAAQPHRTGFLARGPTDGRPLAVDLPAEGPVPPPPTH